MIAPICTGFLISNRLLVTAGHCHSATCEKEPNNIWYFDYTRSFLSNTPEVDGLIKLDRKDVFKCKKVLEHYYIGNAFLDIEQIDYALILLDKPVNRPHLDIRTTGRIEKNTPVITIGHPSGLVKMISDEAQVRYCHNTYYFWADLDAIDGSSGSPVINPLTNKVEGLIVRSSSGTRSFYLDSTHDCFRFKVQKYYYGGTDISRINLIPNLDKWMNHSFR